MTGTSERTASLTDAALVFLLSALVFAVAHRHGLASPFVINDDARQQIYWMQRYQDAALYPASLLNDFAAAYVPVGVKALYAAASPIANPLFFSKLVTGILYCATALAFFGIGRTVGGRSLGYFCAASVWLLPFFLKNISGGLSRSFAAPLLALFLLAWLRKSRVGMAFGLIAQAATIPYMCVLSTGSCLLAYAVSRLRRLPRPPFPGRLPDFLVIAACAGTVYAMNHGLEATGFGPLASVADMTGNPAFSAAGRLDLYPLPNPFFDLIYTPFEGIGLFLDIGLFPGILSLAAIAAVVVVGARRADYTPLDLCRQPVISLLLGSLVLYLAARLLALRLFVPDRYVSYSLNMLYALALAFFFHAALAPVLSRRWATAGLLALSVGLGAFRLTDAGLYDYGDQAALYAAVRQTPTDAVFAGHPELMDNVLTFGRRNVQASFELAHPWMTGYWRQYEPRLDDLFTAYYASDAQTVRDFANKYGVDYLIANEADFSREFLAGQPFFAPFDQTIRDLAASATSRRRGFILLDREAFPGIQVSEGVRLIPLRSAPAAGF
ncbi:hypothetical protein G3N56_04575 [Desulfovibrio sulfodismutans]|uniref:Glycosyltransferase RgtA/B/C/D-like domain-containing protein n=1 Tax=Desulfolutivibrio sulfodismutans TaxID=63561 RepID=A0A7K3NLF2_9BACT|nr:hypothetical protein [Desulfolutivibrio sulfodismutans]NDY56019.1 hypothetical protein [Desulfolutivibrio sulfodismutans]QLA13256.1 hypothetical protein GD606_13770 [Desulfolutivibrio sulfodismutans DSM 3696]